MEEARRRRALRDAEMDQLEEEEAAMMGETKEEKQTELEKGSIVFDVNKSEKDRKTWTVVKKLGEGNFGRVYLVHGEKNGETFAMKTETIKKGGVLKMEKEVLTALKGRPNSVKIVEDGVYETLSFVLMTLVGIDLLKLREIVKGELSEALCLNFFIKALASLKEIHETGYLHRDLKLENLCIGRSSEAVSVYILDFGMARKYVTETFGALKIRRPRDSPAFRGNLLNASRRAHRGQDLGRSDDIESLCYVFMSLCTNLPWRNADSALIRMWKTERMEEVLKRVSPVFRPIWQLIEKSTYSERPKYVEIFDVLTTRMAELKGRLTQRPDFYDQLVKEGLLEATKGTTVLNEEEELKQIKKRLQRVEIGEGEELLAPVLEDFFSIQNKEKPKKKEKKVSSSSADNTKAKTARRRK